MDHQSGNQKHDRISLACETCRKRKRKCDGNLPCSLCTKNHLECVYVTERKRKRRLDSSYITTLEDENSLLKAYIHQLGQDKSVSSLPAHISELLANYGNEQDESLVPPPADSGQLDNSEVPNLPVTGEDPAIDDVSSMIWKMNISDNGISSFVGPSGNFCFPLVRHTDPAPDLSLSAQSLFVSPSMGTAADISESVALSHGPSGSVGELLTLFARYINSVHHFVDDDTLPLLESVSQPGPHYSLLRNAIIAAAALFSDDLCIREQMSRKYAEAAAVDVLRCCRDYPSTVTIQALAILCWRELGLENENEAWLYNGIAVSVCVHLGLHVSSLGNVREGHNSSTTTSLDRLDQTHKQNRTFWASFSMDRMATSIMGRNCMLPTSRVYAIPLIESFGPHPSPGEIVFHYHTRAWLLHDRWMDSIYSFDFNTLAPSKQLQLLMDARGELQTFLRTLPPEASLKQKEVSRDTVILHMIHHMSCLLIHRPYLREAPSTVARSLASKVSVEAASQLVTLIKAFSHAKSTRLSQSMSGPEGNEVEISDWSKAPFVVVHCILTAAISLLLNVASSGLNQGTRGQLISRFRVCFAALASMAPRWLRARRAVLLLRQLAQRWNIISALPIEYSAPLNDSEVRILGKVGGNSGRKNNETASREQELQLDHGMWPAEMDSGPWAPDTYGLEFLSGLDPDSIGEPLDWTFDDLLDLQHDTSSPHIGFT